MGNGFCGGRGRRPASHGPANLRHHCYRHADAGHGRSAVAGRSAETVASNLAYGALGAIGSGDHYALGQSGASVCLQALRSRRVEVPADPIFCSQRSAAESGPARVSNELDCLPSLPQVYLQLNEELRRPEPSLQRIDELIGADMAMTAKILKLVNSAFFCLPCEISSASHAVQLLGLDTLRTLVLTAHVFEQFQSPVLTAADVRQISDHSLAVSNSARKIAMLEHADQHIQNESFTAGLLHDAGKLILASALGEQYGKVLEYREQADVGLYAAERELLGCSHAQVAAYLLGLWGLPSTIVEAVAWHHD